MKPLQHRPMRGGALAIEQPGVGQQERPTADRGRAPDLGGDGGQPFDQRCGVDGDLENVRRTGHDHRVDGAQVQCIERHGLHRRALHRRYRPARLAGDMAAIARHAALVGVMGCGPEHRLRTGEIEQADIRIQHEHDIARHGFNGRGSGRRRIQFHGSREEDTGCYVVPVMACERVQGHARAARACKCVQAPYPCGNAAMRRRFHFCTNPDHPWQSARKRDGSLAENQGTLSFTVHRRLISIQARPVFCGDAFREC